MVMSSVFLLTSSSVRLFRLMSSQVRAVKFSTPLIVDTPLPVQVMFFTLAISASLRVSFLSVSNFEAMKARNVESGKLVALSSTSAAAVSQLSDSSPSAANLSVNE